MQAGSAGLTHECERVLFAGARSAGTRQQVRAAARGFVRRHRRDVGYLRWVLRTVTASSAVAIALLGLATDPASAGVAPFVQRVGSANPLNGYDAGSYTTPAFGDLDGDGDLDVVAGVLDGTLHYYSNIGTSTIPDFSEFGGIESPFNGVDVGLWSIPTLVDLDADGDLDFMSGDSSGQFFYYKNTGSATSPAFIPQTGAANPLNSGPVGDVGSDSAPSFGDLDGDGDLDVVVGEYDGVFNYFENTGNATAPAFVARTGAANPLDGLDVGLVSIPSLGDIDGDGDLDVVSGEATLGVFLYFENTGNAKSPAFVQRTGSANPFGLSSVATLSTTALGDLDGDGDLDLIAGNRYGLFFYFENRRGTIVLRNGSANPLNGQDVGFDSAPAPGDLDGDGDFDVVAASSTGYFAYYQNTGTAGNPAFFARTGAANPLNGLAGGLYASPAIGDLDGDGDLDLLAGNNGGLFTYLRNTGTATSPAFLEINGASNPMNGADIGSYAAPALGDLDGDGDLDLVTGERLGALMYYENTGTALSPAFALRTGAANPLDGQDLGNYSAPSFGDLDHDGDFDVVAGSQDGVFYYFENTGSRFNPVFAARFGASNPFVSFGVTASSQPTIADFDRDGDVDLVTGQHYGAFLYFESFLAQQPSAIAVTGIANPLNGQDVGALSAPALADLDRDGDLDAVAGETAGTFLHYENTGSSLVPRFVARTGAANPLSGRDAGDEAKPTLADLDGDGDFDLLAGKLTGDFSYYTNTGTARTPLFAAPVINPFGLDDVGSHSAPAFADLDSDGDLDLVAGEYEGGFAYFQNTGDASSPGFVERFGLANPLNGVVVSYYATPTLADFDGDGDLDLVSGAEHGRLFWFRNTGTAIAPAFELLGNPGNLAVIDVGDRSAPASGDLNGDGTPDLVTGAVSGTFALHYLPEPARAFLFAAGAALLGWIERLRRRGS